MLKRLAPSVALAALFVFGGAGCVSSRPSHKLVFRTDIIKGYTIDEGYATYVTDPVSGMRIELAAMTVTHYNGMQHSPDLFSVYGDASQINLTNKQVIPPLFEMSVTDDQFGPDVRANTDKEQTLHLYLDPSGGMDSSAGKGMDLKVHGLRDVHVLAQETYEHSGQIWIGIGDKVLIYDQVTDTISVK